MSKQQYESNVKAIPFNQNCVYSKLADLKNLEVMFKETMKSLRESEDVRVFNDYVRVDSAIEWSQDNSKPVVAYKKYSRSAIEYRSLAKEIVEYANR
jgi:cellulose biosynthesis protein BcsQ